MKINYHTAAACQPECHAGPGQRRSGGLTTLGYNRSRSKILRAEILMLSFLVLGLLNLSTARAGSHELDAFRTIQCMTSLETLVDDVRILNPEDMQERLNEARLLLSIGRPALIAATPERWKSTMDLAWQASTELNAMNLDLAKYHSGVTMSSPLIVTHSRGTDIYALLTPKSQAHEGKAVAAELMPTWARLNLFIKNAEYEDFQRNIGEVRILLKAGLPAMLKTTIRVNVPFAKLYAASEMNAAILKLGEEFGELTLTDLKFADHNGLELFVLIHR